MQPVTSVCQTLEEIDFERGIWPAALNGDTERVRKILSRGENPDVPDSSSFTALVSERDISRHFASTRGARISADRYLWISAIFLRIRIVYG